MTRLRDCMLEDVTLTVGRGTGEFRNAKTPPIPRPGERGESGDVPDSRTAHARARPARARRVLVRYRVRAARRHARPRVGSRGRAVPSRSVGRRTSTGKRYPRPIDGEGWQVHERWKRKIYAHRPVGRSRPVWCRAKPRPGKTDGERGGAGGLGARTREALKPPRPPGRAVGNRGHLKSHLKAAHTSIELRACRSFMRSLQGKESRAKKSKSRDSLTYALGSSRAKIRSVRS